MASKVAVPFFVPTRMNESSCCFYILVSIWSCQFWTVASHSNTCGMVSLCLPSEFSSVQLLSHVRLFAAACTAVCQAPLFITNSWSLLKLTSFKSVMTTNRLIWCLLLLLPSIFPSIRVFSTESVLRIKWPKYWSFSFSISPSHEYSGLISFRIDWFDQLLLYYYCF